MTEPDTIVVFTARSPDRIVGEGGSQAWVLNAARAKQCKWLVCTQNRHNPDHEFSDATEPHGGAFMIAKIAALRPSPERPERWIIEISEYARLKVPDVWQHLRNPVRYTSLAELGIDVHSEFTPLGTATRLPPGAPSARRPAEGLTILEAKKGLAATFGVSPDAVEITIRG